MNDADPEPKPSLKPTAPSTLLVAALAAGALVLVIFTSEYLQVPSWYTPTTLLLLAMVLAYTAYTTKTRIERKPGARPVEPLLFARFAALAKASSIGGATIAGAYAGLLVFLVAHRHLEDAQTDLPLAIYGFVACLVLVAAALWLERCCRIPADDDDTDGDARANG